MANAVQPFISNPYGSFDASQFQDPYSSFNGPGQIPGWPTQYRGVPTDAFGNPLPQFAAAQQASPAQPAPAAIPGTTLNSPGQSWALMTPQQRVAATNAANPDPNNAAFANAWFNTRGAQPSNPFISDRVQPVQATSATPAAAPSGFNSYQAALDALSSPGPLKQYGATAPQATQPSSEVLQNFLANWQPQGGSGPGSQFTAAFNKALRG